MLEHDTRNVFLVEKVGHGELRMLEASFRLTNEMIDLGSGDACHLILGLASNCVNESRACVRR